MSIFRAEGCGNKGVLQLICKILHRFVRLKRLGVSAIEGFVFCTLIIKQVIYHFTQITSVLYIWWSSGSSYC